MTDTAKQRTKKKRKPLCHDTKDCVDEWGYESFPASDPPAHGSSYRRRMELEKALQEQEAEDEENA